MSQQHPCQILDAVFSRGYVEKMWKRLRTVRNQVPDVGMKGNTRQKKGRRASRDGAVRFPPRKQDEQLPGLKMSRVGNRKSNAPLIQVDHTLGVGKLII